MTTLAPCSSCNRHVRSGDACPFCGAGTNEIAASPLARTSRAALFAIATVACGQPAQVQPHGAPPIPQTAEDASAPATTATTTASATPTATVPPSASSGTTSVAAYGAPPQPTLPRVTPKQ